MADTNRAVIYHGTQDVRVENVPDAGFVLEDGPGVHPDAPDPVHRTLGW